MPTPAPATSTHATLVPAPVAPASTTSATTTPTCSPPVPDTPIPSTPTSNALIPSRPRTIRHRRSRSDKGAITAEYAVLIVGVCGFGGAMVALLRSPAMQAVLKGIVNFGLKLAGVEGVHL